MVGFCAILDVRTGKDFYMNIAITQTESGVSVSDWGLIVWKHYVENAG